MKRKGIKRKSIIKQKNFLFYRLKETSFSFDILILGRDSNKGLICNNSVMRVLDKDPLRTITNLIKMVVKTIPDTNTGVKRIKKIITNNSLDSEP